METLINKNNIIFLAFINGVVVGSFVTLVLGSLFNLAFNHIKWYLYRGGGGEVSRKNRDSTYFRHDLEDPEDVDCLKPMVISRPFLVDSTNREVQEFTTFTGPTIYNTPSAIHNLSTTPRMSRGETEDGGNHPQGGEKDPSKEESAYMVMGSMPPPTPAATNTLPSSRSRPSTTYYKEYQNISTAPERKSQELTTFTSPTIYNTLPTIYTSSVPATTEIPEYQNNTTAEEGEHMYETIPPRRNRLLTPLLE